MRLTILIYLLVGMITVDLAASSPPIKSVTIFKGRAYVLREFSGKLEAKEQKIIFENLPVTLDAASFKVQVSNDKVVEVLGVRHQQIFNQSYKSEKLNRLTEQQEQLRQKLELIQRSGQELHRNHRDLRDIQKYYRESFALNINAKRWSAKKFAGFVKFLKSRNHTLYNQWSKLFARFIKVDQQLGLVRARLQELGGNRQKAHINVEVDIKVLTAGRYQVGLQYLVPGASWTPVYDIRIQGRKAVVEQYALVDQNSGESWDRCEILLSNNRAKLNTKLPVLGPTTLSYRVVSKVKVQVKSRQKRGKRLEVDQQKSGARQVAPKQEGITKVFKVKGRQTILDGSHKVKLFIAKKSTRYQEELEIIAPKYKLAYRRGDILNPFNWALVPGKVNIFYQGQFMQQMDLDLVPKKGRFHLNAGIDYDIKFERWVNSVQKSEGVINKEQVYFRNITSVVTNYTNKKKVIKVLEQVPISEMKSLVVKMATGSDQFEPLKGYPSWYYRNITLTADQSKKIQLKLVARAPAEMGFSW